MSTRINHVVGIQWAARSACLLTSADSPTRTLPMPMLSTVTNISATSSELVTSTATPP